jgi:aspartate racemase
MEEDFYKRRLAEKHGLKVLIPDGEDRGKINRIIFDELCLGVVKPESREYYLDVIGKLARAGAEGVVLGCTEIELLVRPEDTHIPLFPTTRLHAEAAAEYAIDGGSEAVF